jgi:hypothetical protein
MEQVEQGMHVLPFVCYGVKEILCSRVEGRLYCLQVHLCFLNLLGEFFAEYLRPYHPASTAPLS